LGQIGFLEDFPKLGFEKLGFRQATPSWGEANLVSGGLTQVGEEQTG